MRKLGFILGLFWLCVPIAARAATCAAGYYLDDGECKRCQADLQASYYCPGDDIRYECPTISGATGYGSVCGSLRGCCWAWFGETVISNGSMDRYWCYIDPDTDTYGESGKSKCGVYTRDLKCDAGYYSDGPGGDDRYEDVLTPAELATRACRPVEPGYYSPDGATERIACPAVSDAVGYGSGAREKRADCWAWFGETLISNGSMDRYWCYIDPDTDTYGESGKSKCGVYTRDLKCDAGYYSDGPGGDDRYEDVLTPAELATRACRPVEPGYYSPDGATNRTACPAGLTTIGYGVAADEAADCGHTLHIGDATVHLRSEKRTKPALHVRIGDDIFYGDISTELKGHIRVKIGDTVYSVFDDSM